MKFSGVPSMLKFHGHNRQPSSDKIMKQDPPFVQWCWALDQRKRLTSKCHTAFHLMLVGMLLIASKPGRWTTNMKNRTYKWPILSRPWFPAHGKDSAKVHERTEPNLRTCSKHNRLHLRSLLKIYLDSLEPTSTSSTVSCLGVSLSPYPYIMPNTAARGTFHSQLPTHFTNSTSIKAP